MRRTSTTLLLWMAALAASAASADEKVFGVAPGKELNLMDKIMQINVNIGKSIPVNTIPDEFRSGNATSVSASTEGVESSDEDSAISVDNEGTAASNAAGPADVPTDGAERGSKRRRHDSTTTHHRKLDRSLDDHRHHGPGSHVKLGQAVAHNSTVLTVTAMHLNGTAVAVPIPAGSSETNLKGSEGRRNQKRAGRAAAVKHAGIERKYGAGGK